MTDTFRGFEWGPIPRVPAGLEPTAETVEIYRRILSTPIIGDDFAPLHSQFRRTLQHARIVHFSPELLAALAQEALTHAEPGSHMPLGGPLSEYGWPGVIPDWTAPPFTPLYIGFGDFTPSMLIGIVDGEVVYRDETTVSEILSLDGQEQYAAFGPNGEGRVDTPVVGLLITQIEGAWGDWLIAGWVVYENRLMFIPFQVPAFGPNEEAKVLTPTPIFMTRLILHALQNAEVEEHTLSRKQKKELRRSGAMGITNDVPAPYYSVRQVSRYDRPAPSEGHRDIEWTHRWDVRAHQRLLHKRGPHPIDPKLRSKLLTRGYFVFERNEPPPEVRAALVARRLNPKRADEWLAVKLCQVRSTIKGPEDKPYVPSVHVAEWSRDLDAELSP